MTETRAIQIPVYRDKEGKPVCGDCALMKETKDYFLCGKLSIEKIFFEKEELTPHKNCPLWAEELENATNNPKP